MFYCKECKYCFVNEKTNVARNQAGLGPLNPPEAECTYPENIEQDTESTWYSETKKTKHKRLPEAINAHNQCEWFEQKEKIAQFGDTLGSEKEKVMA